MKAFYSWFLVAALLVVVKVEAWVVGRHGNCRGGSEVVGQGWVTQRHVIQATDSTTETACVKTTKTKKKEQDFFKRIQKQTRKRQGRAPAATTAPEQAAKEKVEVSVTTVIKAPAVEKQAKTEESSTKDTTASRLHWLELLLATSRAAAVASDMGKLDEADKSVGRYALASEDAWTAYFDMEGTGLVFYFNEDTGESRWRPPTKTFPKVKLSAKLNRIAEEKKREYLAVQAEQKKPAVGRTAAKENTKAEVQESDGFWATMLAPYGGGGTKTQEKPKMAKSSSSITRKVEKKIEDLSKKQKTVQTSKSSAFSVDPEVLATEGDWDAYCDTDGTNYVYYYNRVTGKSEWEPPTKTFPVVNLSNAKMKSILTTSSADSDDRPRPLASQGDWTAYFDAQNTCLIYYYNEVTDTSQWEKPTEDFPQIRLTKQMRNRILCKYQTMGPVAGEVRPLAPKGDCEDDTDNDRSAVQNEPRQQQEPPIFVTWLLDAVFALLDDNSKKQQENSNPFHLVGEFFNGLFSNNKDSKMTRMDKQIPNSPTEIFGIVFPLQLPNVWKMLFPQSRKSDSPENKLFFAKEVSPNNKSEKPASLVEQFFSVRF